jgi:hypothetical protein
VAGRLAVKAARLQQTVGVNWVFPLPPPCAIPPLEPLLDPASRTADLGLVEKKCFETPFARMCSVPEQETDSETTLAVSLGGPERTTSCKNGVENMSVKKLSKGKFPQQNSILRRCLFFG